MIRHLLVPLDGSSLAERAVAHALLPARAMDAPITLVRVVAGVDGAAGGEGAVEGRLRRAEARSYLEGVAERVREAGVAARVRLGEGSAGEAIVRVAETEGCDLLMMTTHGRGEAHPFDLGGTAHKVVSASGRSVLLVRPGEPQMEVPTDRLSGEEETGLREPRCDRILACTDGSARSEWAACLAARLARAAGAELVLAHVSPAPGEAAVPGAAGSEGGEGAEGGRDGRVAEAARAAGRAMLAELAEKLSGDALEIRTVELSAASVTRALHDLAGRERPGLVVLSAHGEAGPAPWPYGSVAAHVLSHGEFPTLVLQDVEAGPPVSAGRDASPCRV